MEESGGRVLSHQSTSSSCISSDQSESSGGLWTGLFSSEQVAMVMVKWLLGGYQATLEDLCVCPISVDPLTANG